MLAGNTAVEKAAKKSGHKIKVPFMQGRGDAKQEQTDVFSFNLLEPKADGFVNYHKSKSTTSPEEMLIDKAQLMQLTGPEMTVLFGGMRVFNNCSFPYFKISLNIMWMV